MTPLLADCVKDYHLLILDCLLSEQMTVASGTWSERPSAGPAIHRALVTSNGATVRALAPVLSRFGLGVPDIAVVLEPL